MTILNMHCDKCNKNTLHIEDTVMDAESATVWHCLVCGNERRPGGGNSFVLAGPKDGKPDSGNSRD